MTGNNESTQLMEYYLGRLGRAAARFSPAEREEIVAEIRSHILERSQVGGVVEPGRVRETLEALGTPEEIASQYVTNALFERAAGSRSPWVMFRATLHWAMLGARGFGIFMIAITGYVAAGAFFVCAVLKPFFPENIGLWYLPSARLFAMGYRGATESPTPELLGHWLPPVAMVLGLLTIIWTTHLLRALIRRRAHAKPGWQVR
jgi:uncharacterized membrane protein